MASAESTGMELRDYLEVVRQRKWIIAACAALVTIVAVTLSLLRTPVYQARARLLFEPNQSLFGSDYGQYVDPSRVQTEIEVIQAEPVQAEVKRRLGSVPPVSAKGVGSTAIIEVSALSTVPGRAAEIANTYAEAYIQYRLRKGVDGMLAATTQIQEKIDDLGKQIEEAERRSPPPGPSGPAPNPERDALIGQRAAFKDKLDQLDVQAGVDTGGPQVVVPATAPVEPVGASTLRHGLMGLGLGLLLGAAVAFAFEHLDESVKTKDDLEKSSPGVPVLGVIPSVSGWKNRKSARLVSSEDPSSPAAEAYRTLRTSIRFMSLERPVRKLAVTSATPSEGKSTTVANLAVALSRAGQRVVIVSCDLRRPRIHEFFGLSNAVGFTSVLLGETPLSSALQDVPGPLPLKVLASGPLPPNPSELLSSGRAMEVLDALQAHADVILLDTPPVLLVTDASVLSAGVDATLVVAMAGVTTRKAVSRTVEILRQVDSRLVGTVLNAASAEGAYGYVYEYSRQERRPAPEKPGRKRDKALKPEKAPPTPDEPIEEEKAAVDS